MMTILRAAAAAALVLPLASNAASAQATNPRVLLEKSATYALDNKIRSFRVPVTDSAGKLKYYDVTVSLKAQANGTLASSATLTSTPSPSIPTNIIPPGDYRAPDGATCRVANVPLNNGRTQNSVSCTPRSGQLTQMSAANGTVAAGHPYFPALQAAGIDKLPDANTSTWGIVNNGNTSLTGCSNFRDDDVISMKTNGSELIITLFDQGSAAKCGVSLVKQ